MYVSFPTSDLYHPDPTRKVIADMKSAVDERDAKLLEKVNTIKSLCQLIIVTHLHSNLLFCTYWICLTHLQFQEKELHVVTTTAAEIAQLLKVRQP